MKKILLLNPPGKYPYLRDQYCSSAAKAGYYWPAVDLLVLSGILSPHFELKVLDAIVEKSNLGDVLDILQKDKYSAVISLASSASKDEDFELFKQIKFQLNIPVIANGGFLRLNPQGYLQNFKFLEAVITDYTQAGIVDFLNGQTVDLEGICIRGGQEVKGSYDPQKYFSYPVPRHDLFPLEKYFTPQSKGRKFSSVLTSYGCSYNCRFCASAKIEYKLRDIPNLIQELKSLTKLGVKEIHFPDFTFTANRLHCFKVCETIIRERLNISWDCLTRSDCFDEQLLRSMKKAGCHTIQAGVETKNENVLKNMGKYISNSTVRQAFALCRKHEIETIGFFIIGLPGEDKKSIKQTIKFAKELNCDYASFSVFVPDFGSDIRQELVAANPQVEWIYDFDRTKFPVISNGFLSPKQIWSLRNKAIRDFYFRWSYVWKRLRGITNFKALINAFKIFWSLFYDQINVCGSRYFKGGQS
ncbi:MAG: radical SAM protein [Candidatus Omnitrophota bacterium]